MCKFQFSDILNRILRDILTLDFNFTTVVLIKTCQCINQFTLSITLNSGDAKDLSALQVKGKIVYLQDTLCIMYSQVTDSHKYIIGKMLFFLIKFQRYFYSHHQT